MSVLHWEVLVEDLSTEAALQILLPKLVGEASFALHPFTCKSEMLMRLPDRLRGYAARRKNDLWFRDNCRIAVLIDGDDDDCKKLKQRIEGMAANAGLVSRRRAAGKPYAVVTRVAIEELEAWYFGDWHAVHAAYHKVDPMVPRQKPFRCSDAVAGGTAEALERLLQKVGYFKTGLRKIEVARAIAQHMEPKRNESPSFKAFASALADG
jgi:Domain of unknown function (DUF4276)